MYKNCQRIQQKYWKKLAKKLWVKNAGLKKSIESNFIQK